MPPRPQSSLLHYLRYATGLWRDDPRSDVDLLAAFTASRDEAVFAVLVNRHGQAVWRACAHVLGDTPEAEDAFQAAFMLLARKPPTLRRESLGGWLYQVAYRLALKARRAGSRRDQLLIDARSRPERESEPESPNELREVVHEELAALPERLRVPLALYYLEGKNQADIARLMKLSDRAIRDRLARGLDVLRKRMADRGMTVSAVALAAALGPLATAQAIPTRLLTDTASAATRFATNPAAAAGPAADLAARLLAPRLPVWPVVVVTALIALAGAVAVAAFTDRPPSPPAHPLAAAEPVAELSLVPTVAPAPRPVTRTFRHDGAVTAVAVSLDGRHVASAGTDHAVRVWDAETGRQVARFDTPPEGVAALTFSPDGSALVVDDPKTGLAVWDLANGRRRHTLIGQAAGVSALAFNPAGDRLVTVGRNGQLHFMNLARQGNQLDRDMIRTDDVAARALHRDGQAFFAEQATKFWTRRRADTPSVPATKSCNKFGPSVMLRVAPDSRLAYAWSKTAPTDPRQS